MTRAVWGTGGVWKRLCNEPWPVHAASALFLTAYPNTGSATALLPYSFNDRLSTAMNLVKTNILSSLSYRSRSLLIPRTPELNQWLYCLSQHHFPQSYVFVVSFLAAQMLPCNCATLSSIGSTDRGERQPSFRPKGCVYTRVEAEFLEIPAWTQASSERKAMLNSAALLSSC